MTADHPVWCRQPHPSNLHASDAVDLATSPVGGSAHLEQDDDGQPYLVLDFVTAHALMDVPLGLDDAAAVATILGDLLALAAGEPVARAVAALAAFSPTRDQAAALLEEWTGRLALTDADVAAALAAFPARRPS